MSPFEWIALAVVATLSSARITRLLTFDKFPPVQWVRDKYSDLTDGNPWELLFYCAFCMGFWVSAVVLLIGYFTGWHEIWWLVNGVFALSYAAPLWMVHDGIED